MKQELQAKGRITQPCVANEQRCLTSVSFFNPPLMDKKLKLLSQIDRLEVERNTHYIFSLPLYYLGINIEKMKGKKKVSFRLKTAFPTLFHH